MWGQGGRLGVLVQRLGIKEESQATDHGISGGKGHHTWGAIGVIPMGMGIYHRAIDNEALWWGVTGGLLGHS